jgi:hypothetical protein
MYKCVLNIDLPYDLAIPLLGIYPKECNTGYSKGTCTPMFNESLCFKNANLIPFFHGDLL